ncbi:FAD/NAD(P)-binding oxidoreductase [Chryseobacterium sp. OV279]|nr:FAD/NAD(P)-binding oxidoreductase [Chryseobacterium sp. OV279]
MESLLGVDPENNVLEIDTGNLRYDYLVLALGTESTFLQWRMYRNMLFL